MGIDFVAIDFETANYRRSSACCVGLAVVQDGEIIDVRQILMRPPGTSTEFSPLHTRLHGIRAEDVAGAPTFADCLAVLESAIGDRPVVAHNATFDIGVVRAACREEGVAWPSIRFTCSMMLARAHLDLLSYSLPYCCEALGVELGQHHTAAADARAAAEIVLRLCAQAGVSSLDELLGSIRGRWNRLESGSFVHRAWLGDGVEPEAATGFFAGQRVAITGTLPGGLVRSEVFDRLSALGAEPQVNVRKDTTLLVIADLNPAVLRPGTEDTGKMRKAQEYRQKGLPIEVMSGDDFLALLDAD